MVVGSPYAWTTRLQSKLVPTLQAAAGSAGPDARQAAGTRQQPGCASCEGWHSQRSRVGGCRPAIDPQACLLGTPVHRQLPQGWRLRDVRAAGCACRGTQLVVGTRLHQRCLPMRPACLPSKGSEGWAHIFQIPFSRLTVPRGQREPHLGPGPPAGAHRVTRTAGCANTAACQGDAGLVLHVMRAECSIPHQRHA